MISHMCDQSCTNDDEYCSYKYIEFLLNLNYDIYEYKNDDARNPDHQSNIINILFRKGDEQIIKMLIAKYYINYSYRDKDNNSLLHISAYNILFSL